MSDKQLSKDIIHTLIGYYQTDNKFITLDNNVIECMSYRIINKEINPDRLCIVNIRWSVELESWIIFQLLFL